MRRSIVLGAFVEKKKSLKRERIRKSDEIAS